MLADAGSDASSGFLTILGIVALAYFIPSFVASVRGRNSANAIFAVNLLLGWTFLGWVAALVWALTDDEGTRARSARKSGAMPKPPLRDLTKFVPGQGALPPPPSTSRACPHCLSDVPAAASVCRYCQRDIPVLT